MTIKKITFKPQAGSVATHLTIDARHKKVWAIVLITWQLPQWTIGNV